jgi:hypothetical protein
MVFPIPSILLPQVVLLTFMQVVETFNIWLLVVVVLVDLMDLTMLLVVEQVEFYQEL